VVIYEENHSFDNLYGGWVGGRERLRRALAKKIFFAGEAVSITQHSSASGAYTSGRDVAANVLAALRA
jgi:phospholipase C